VKQLHLHVEGIRQTVRRIDAHHQRAIAQPRQTNTCGGGKTGLSYAAFATEQQNSHRPILYGGGALQDRQEDVSAAETAERRSSATLVCARRRCLSRVLLRMGPSADRARPEVRIFAKVSLGESTGGQPARWSSYPQERNFVILFAMRWPEDYCLLTPGRKSAWGVLSLGRTDVGE